MSSYISRFSPWLLALAGLVVIELAYYAVARPPRVLWNSFLDLQFGQTETFQRLVAHDKIVAFADTDAEVIQVGDSSGFHGVQPPIVISHLPGHRYLNLSVATNLGYSGYYNVAKLQLERSPSAKYLVLYASLVGGVPRRILWDEDQKLMAPLIHKEFLSPFYKLFQLPSLAARQQIVTYAYSMGFRFRLRDEPLSMNRGYLAFRAVFRESGGWTRETDVEGDVPTGIFHAFFPGVDLAQADPAVIRAGLRQFPRITDETFFDWRTLTRVSYFDHVYGKFAQLARDHNVRLVLIFNPFPESARRPEFDELMDWKAIKAALERLPAKYPDVVMTEFEFWPDDRFSVFSHVSTIYSHESSHRVGRIMRQVIGAPNTSAGGRNAPALPRAASAMIDFSRPHPGYGWTDDKGDTPGFPLRYVGPRDRAWMFVSLAPGSSYDVIAAFDAANREVAGQLAMTANGTPAKSISSGRDGDAFYAEWHVPAESIDVYGGWMTLEFSLGDPTSQAGAGKPGVSFKRIVAVPASDR